jgi:hypothetical protein
MAALCPLVFLLSSYILFFHCAFIFHADAISPQRKQSGGAVGRAAAMGLSAPAAAGDRRAPLKKKKTASFSLTFFTFFATFIALTDTDYFSL